MQVEETIGSGFRSRRVAGRLRTVPLLAGTLVALGLLATGCSPHFLVSGVPDGKGGLYAVTMSGKVMLGFRVEHCRVEANGVMACSPMQVVGQAQDDVNRWITSDENGLILLADHQLETWSVCQLAGETLNCSRTKAQTSLGFFGESQPAELTTALGGAVYAVLMPDSTRVRRCRFENRQMVCQSLPVVVQGGEKQ
jgi:hypothetical protein